MNLKKIELQGFKSFGDKTEINFETNITGIVGPNGCGKSNVIDAVRWVLGEQAPTTLRVQKMPDLIFNGTESRRSQSYCEVSLYLDNSDGRYPIEFDEVVVTRKLDRSGESEYLINRRPCRMRDIIDLFRDSGIGKEGYSIIGQGKIDEILSSKPDGRRKIFEEAAGISKHKARKIETERKLNAGRADMQRLTDLLSEVSSSLVPLEKEAGDARKVKAYRAELKYQEVALYLYQCENSAANRERITAKLDKLRKEHAEQSAELERLNNEYTVTMMSIENGDKYSNSVRDAITDLMVAAEKAAGDSRAFARDIEHINEDNAKIAESLKADETKLADRAKQIEEKFFKADAKRKEADKERAALEDLRKEQSELAAEVEREEKAIEAGREMFLDKLSKNAEIEKDVAALELERKLLIDGLSSNKDDYDDKLKIRDKVAETRAKLAAQADELTAEKTSRQAELVKASENRDAAKREYDEALQRRTDLGNRIQNLTFKLETIEENINKYFDYEGSIQNLMAEAVRDPAIKEMIVGTVAEIISVPKDVQIAVEIALGRSLQSVITKNEYDASKLMQRLRERNLGRATFLPMTTMKRNDLSREQARALDEDGIIGVASELVRYDGKYDNIISNLLGKTVIAEDQDAAMRVSKKYGYSFRIVTLDGDVYAPSGALTGGSTGKNTGRILSRESEKEDMSKKLRQAKKDMELLKEDIADRESELEKLSSSVAFIQSRISKLELDILKISGDIAQCDRELELYGAEMDKLFGGNEESRKRIKEIELALQEADKNKKGADTERIDVDEYVSELREKFAEDKRRYNELTSAVMRKTVEVNALDNEADTLEKDIAALKAESKMIEQEMLELNVRLKMNESNLQRIKEQLARSEFAPEDKAKLDELRAELAGLEDSRVKMNARVKELDVLRAEKSDEAAKTREKVIREEANLEMVDSTIATMSTRMQENYGFDFDAAKEYFAGVDAEAEGYVFAPDKAQSHINGLRTKIERIGPINELAEQRFAEESERCNYMQSQLDDLQKAEQDLLRIIDELTTEMVEKFTVSFNQINKNFNEVFSELFGGGRARMELEKGVSVLEAGIEIMAEPPGKKLSNLAPLSGGERALTAIAILFAIIKLNPMPFSILDEIEAALDEANAHLFAQYLKKFSQFTQFIVVTHRKPTMQLCDTLFGVTMQEKGVSRTVRVRLDEAVKHADEKSVRNADGESA